MKKNDALNEPERVFNTNAVNLFLFLFVYRRRRRRQSSGPKRARDASPNNSNCGRVRYLF